MAPNFFCWIFWEAIFLVDETPTVLTEFFFENWLVQDPTASATSEHHCRKGCGEAAFYEEIWVFLGPFFGTLRDSKALGRFVFFFEIWGFLEFWKKIPGFFEFTMMYATTMLPLGWPPKWIHKIKQDQASGTVPGWYSQGRRIWLRHVSFGKLDKRKETPIRRQESSNESCERGPIGPFSFFSELNYRLGRVSNTWGIG